MSESILKEYDAKLPLIAEYTATLEGLVRTLLRDAGITPQSMSSRVKSRHSLSEKLNRPEKNYGSLNQITDICGIRIITYFKEEVDSVARLLDSEMTVDTTNSVDKRAYESPDRFGYQSLHAVVSLSRNRCELREYRKYLGLKAEIQIRTVIQHAWAEIEHDLGYKSEVAVPIPIRRRFHRLAAILELSDEEFAQIKIALSDYEKALPLAIMTMPESIALDGTSMDAFVMKNARLDRIETTVADANGCIRDETDREFTEQFADYFHWLGIKTIDVLDKVFAEKESTVLKLMNKNVRGFENKQFTKGLGMIYLCYAIMASEKNHEKLRSFFKEFGFGGSDSENAAFAQELIEIATT